MLNFQITIMLVLFAFVLVLIVIPDVLMMARQLDTQSGLVGDIFTILPPLPILFVALFTMYQAVANTFRALTDKPIRYPFSIPFIQ